MKEANKPDEKGAEQVIKSWPSWMREYQITKYGSTEKRNSDAEFDLREKKGDDLSKCVFG